MSVAADAFDSDKSRFTVSNQVAKQRNRLSLTHPEVHCGCD